MAELKPCPFCGEDAEFERRGDARQSTIINCTNCGATLETGAEWDHEREWNRRPEEDRLRSELQAIILMSGEDAIIRRAKSALSPKDTGGEDA